VALGFGGRRLFGSKVYGAAVMKYSGSYNLRRESREVEVISVNKVKRAITKAM
jgi:hypothetical protein